jgi:ABC-2 type transport system ATP-binding protein
LAVACLPDAPILILDEPTLSLDPEGAIRFREFLAILKRQGKTIVLASHMLEEVEQLADRVGILVGGKLIALQSMHALRDGLSHMCNMEVVLSNPTPQCAEAARRAGATLAKSEGRVLRIASTPAQRLPILQAIESAGGKIATFATRDLSLEEIYLRCIRGELADKE